MGRPDPGAGSAGQITNALRVGRGPVAARSWGADRLAPVEQERPRLPRIAVVGGGLSGLVAAWRLRDLAQVVVLERSDVLGGVLRLGELAGLTVDLGAESVLARRPEALDLFGELGLAADVVHPATSAACVRRDGRWYPLPPRTVLGVPSDPAAARGLLTPDEVDRALAEPEPAEAPSAEPDPDEPASAEPPDQDVATWVGSRMGPAVVDRLVEPLLGGVYAGHARLLSAQVTLPALWREAGSGGRLLDAAAAVVAAPAATGPVFAGLSGGIGRLPQRLAEQLRAHGVTIRTGVTVRALEPMPDHAVSGWGAWRLTLGPASEPQVLDVDAVVLAVPAAPSARLLATVCPQASAELGQVETASLALVACALPRAHLAHVPPGSGVLVPPAEGHPVKAITFASAKWAWLDAQDADLAVVRLSVGRHREEAILQRDDADLAALAVADAEQLLGTRLSPVETRVVRWGGALPQPMVGHRDRVARIRRDVARWPGLAVCGSLYEGVGIPACIAAATAAAASAAAGCSEWLYSR